MFGSDHEFPRLSAFNDSHDVGSASSLLYSANPPMVPRMGHTFVCAGVKLHYYLLTIAVLMQ